MADKTVLIELSVEGGNALSKVNELTNSLKTLEKGTDEYKQAVKELAEQERILTKAQKARDKAQKESSKQMKQVKTDTGAATSATLELGRVFSDMPYGIRGVANNLQQLAANLFFMSKKTDATTGKLKGFGGALRSLIGNLAGPAGLLVAFQAIVAAFDYFSDSQKEAKDKTEKTTSAIDKQRIALVKLIEKQNFWRKLKVTTSLDLAKETALLNTHIRAIRLQSNSEEERAYALEKLIKLYPKYFKGIKVDDLKSLAIAEEKTNKELIRGNKFKEIQIKLTELGGKKILLTEKLKQVQIKLTNKITLKSLLEQKKLEEELLSIKVKTLKFNESAAFLLARGVDPKESPDKGKGKGKVKKISPFKTPKELDLDVESNLKAIDKLNKSTEKQVLKNNEKEELSLATTEEQKKAIKEKYASKNLEVQIKYELKALDLKAELEKTNVRDKQRDYVKGLDEKLEAYKKSLMDENNALSDASKKEIALATTERDKKKKASEEELRLTVFGIEEEYAKLFPFWTKLNDARRDALGIGSDEKKEDPIKAWFDKYTFYVEQAKALISGVADFVDAEFERELTIEKNKTTELNNELNKRLLNENLSKSQKESIQNQIAQNDEKLRVKQEKIARKRFKVMKAFNLATALTDTYLATQKAYTSQLQLDPTSPIRAKIAAGVALAAGLANVAAIARTRFESSSGTSPAINGGGGSGGSARAEPSFNIVGRSNENLLLNAIQSQFDQPLRAYVVARDVTNQQQMDGVISGAAST